MRALVSGYRDLVRDIQHMVSRVVPAGGDVMVVSKGDDNLLQLGERTGRHFPETDTGVYVGYHPRDSAAAITALESAIDRGHEYLLFPGTVAVVARSLRGVSGASRCSLFAALVGPAVRPL